MLKEIFTIRYFSYALLYTYVFSVIQKTLQGFCIIYFIKTEPEIIPRK